MSYYDNYRLQGYCGFVIELIIFFYVGRVLFSYTTQIYEERKLLVSSLFSLFRRKSVTFRESVVEYPRNYEVPRTLHS